MNSVFQIPVAPAGSSRAAGADTQVQFNDGGTNLGGDAKLTFNKTTGVLTVNGTGVGPTPPAGADTQVQFNDGGSAFGGDAKLAFNKTTGVLTVNGLKLFTYSGALADDATLALPAITNAAKGSVQIGNLEQYAEFLVDNDGDVTLLLNSGNVVAGADTDTNLCIGTAATQEPLQLKNRLGASKNINVVLWYN